MDSFFMTQPPPGPTETWLKCVQALEKKAAAAPPPTVKSSSRKKFYGGEDSENKATNKLDNPDSTRNANALFGGIFTASGGAVETKPKDPNVLSELIPRFYPAEPTDKEQKEKEKQKELLQKQQQKARDEHDLTSALPHFDDSDDDELLQYQHEKSRLPILFKVEKFV